MSLNNLKSVVAANSQPASVHVKSRADMVKNDDGAYVFEIDSMARLHRFLVSGVSGNYYRPASQLSAEMIALLDSLTPDQQAQAVNLAVEISVAGRSSKNEYAIFVVAYLMCKGVEDVRKACEAAVLQVCRTGTHILLLCDSVKSIGGWSKLRRRAVQNWYMKKSIDKLTLQIVKYANRGGWTHRDVMRQVHLKATGELARVINYAVNNGQKDQEGNDKYQHESGHNTLLDAVIAVKSVQTIDEAVKLVLEHRLPHEVIPSGFKSKPAMQYALLMSMPYMAMLRNLASYSKSGLLVYTGEKMELSSSLKKLLGVSSVADMQDKALAHVKATLSDMDILQKARIHPMHVLLAAKTYATGHNARGDSSWKVNPDIVSILDKAFVNSIGMQDVVDKSVLICLDVSPSMFSASIQDSSITAAEASGAFSLCLQSAFKAAKMVKFDTQLKPVSFSGSLSSALQIMKTEGNKGWGGTDCSLPASYALEQFESTGRVYDAIIILTDNDTNSRVHPYQVLEKYRKRVGKPVKQIVMAFSASNFTIADPKDMHSMDFPGLDSDLVTTAQKFISGEI